MFRFLLASYMSCIAFSWSYENYNDTTAYLYKYSLIFWSEILLQKKILLFCNKLLQELKSHFKKRNEILFLWSEFHFKRGKTSIIFVQKWKFFFKIDSIFIPKDLENIKKKKENISCSFGQCLCKCSSYVEKNLF